MASGGVKQGKAELASMKARQATGRANDKGDTGPHHAEAATAHREAAQAHREAGNTSKAAMEERVAVLHDKQAAQPTTASTRHVNPGDVARVRQMPVTKSFGAEPQVSNATYKSAYARHADRLSQKASEASQKAADPAGHKAAAIAHIDAREAWKQAGHDFRQKAADEHEKAKFHDLQLKNATGETFGLNPGSPGKTSGGGSFVSNPHSGSDEYNRDEQGRFAPK